MQYGMTPSRGRSEDEFEYRGRGGGGRGGRGYGDRDRDDHEGGRVGRGGRGYGDRDRDDHEGGRGGRGGRGYGDRDRDDHGGGRGRGQAGEGGRGGRGRGGVEEGGRLQRLLSRVVKEEPADQDDEPPSTVFRVTMTGTPNGVPAKTSAAKPETVAGKVNNNNNKKGKKEKEAEQQLVSDQDARAAADDLINKLSKLTGGKPLVKPIPASPATSEAPQKATTSAPKSRPTTAANDKINAPIGERPVSAVTVPSEDTKAPSNDNSEGTMLLSRIYTRAYLIYLRTLYAML